MVAICSATAVATQITITGVTANAIRRTVLTPHEIDQMTAGQKLILVEGMKLGIQTARRNVIKMLEGLGGQEEIIRLVEEKLK